MKQNLKHNPESDSPPGGREQEVARAVQGGDTSAVLGGKVPSAPPSGHALPRDPGKRSRSLADMIAVLSDKITALQNSTTERFAEQTEKIAELKTFAMEKFTVLTDRIAVLETSTTERIAALETRTADRLKDMTKWMAALFVGAMVVFSIVMDHRFDSSMQDMRSTIQGMQATMQQLVGEREEP